MKRRPPVLLILVSALLLIPLLAILALYTDSYFFYQRMNSLTTTFDQGKNGLWLGSKWYLGNYTNAELQQLSKTLNANGIAYAFLHCRGTNKDGRLNVRKEKLPNELTTSLRKLCPKTKLIAWVGVMGTEANLADLQVQDNLLAEAKWLISSADFDGIQWDYEPHCDKDPLLLNLLKSSKTYLPLGCVLSTDVSSFFSSDYLRELCKYCDLIAVEGYDTYAFFSPRVYADLIKECTVRYSQAVDSAGANTRILIGLPTYEESNPIHHGFAENLLAGIIGVKSALKEPECARDRIDGISIYAEYTTQPYEWVSFQTFWRRNPQAK